MRLIDANALKDAIMQEVYKDRVGVFVARRIFKLIDNAPTVSEITKEKLSVAYDQGYEDGKNNWLQEERPKGEWVRKEDLIHYIATQYSEHNELVPIWLSIGDWKGVADMRGKKK